MVIFSLIPSFLLHFLLDGICWKDELSLYSPFCLYVCCLFVYSRCGLVAAYSVGWYSACHSIAQID